jgi:hypothetical protein
MTPSSFTFKLTVPNDPEGVTVVSAVAAHAVQYARLDEDAGAAFVERVRDAARQAFTSATGTSCAAIFSAENGELTVSIDGHSASQPLPA